MIVFSKLFQLLATLFLLLLWGSGVGILFGNILFGFCAVAVTITLWNIRYLFVLYQWAEKTSGSRQLPSAPGTWGEIFDAINRMQKQHLRVEKKSVLMMERIQQSTAALNDGIVMIDSQGVVEWWNPAAEKLIGLKADRIKSQRITRLLSNPDFLRHFESKEYQHTVDIPSPVDEAVELQLHIAVYGNDQRLMTIRNVTRIRQLERMRKDFVANVSHELRTPLTVVSGYLETMLDNLNGDLHPSFWEKALTSMKDQTDRMSRLVTDLLLLSKLESSETAHFDNAIHLKSMLEQIVQDGIVLSGKLQHTISLDCPDSVYMMGNSSELFSAFSNLVFNAVRYTQAGGDIRIFFWHDKAGGHVTVKDNGPGIDPSHIPRLTERFYRIDRSRSQNTGGTGLGLAIVKHVMIRHGGMLSIDSSAGEGCEFTCTFPDECFDEET